MRESFVGVSGRASYAGVPESFAGEADDDTRTRTSASLLARAKKREVTAQGHRRWMVDGLRKLGDAYPSYAITYDGATYDCSCYHTNHGDSRARKMCSHVLAVILYRRSHGEISGSGTETLPTDNGVDATAPAPEVVVTGTVPLPGLEVRGDSVIREGAGGVVHSPSPSLPAPTPTIPGIAPVPDGWQPVPEWLRDYRPDQLIAAERVVEAFVSGAKVVFLDAPTGAGKTAIADLVSRMLAQRAIYICTSIALQHQVEDDFPYAKVIKGRANYPTVAGRSDITTADCDRTRGQDDCSFCPSIRVCPYMIAKWEAAQAQIGVLNTAYWLREAMGRQSLFSRKQTEQHDPSSGGFLVIDECDTLKDALLGVVEFRLTTSRLRQLGLWAPKKGVQKKTIAFWMLDELIPALEAHARQQPANLNGRRIAKAVRELRDEAKRVAAEVESENWIRDNSDGFAPLVLKPVQVAPYGEPRVWRHAGRVLAMSATIISPDEIADSTGLDPSLFRTITMGSSFPATNRPVYVAPVANVTNAEKDTAWPILARACHNILDRHPGERVLIHTVSYQLTNYLMEQLSDSIGSRRVLLTYTKSPERMQALNEFRDIEGAVLLAPSFERGVDLADDACRVQIIAKVPYGNRGDARVNARLRQPGGETEYIVDTIRTLVQMTGRAVRSAEDHATTYILDAQFVRSIKKKWRRYLPDWWTDALVDDFNVRELTK